MTERLMTAVDCVSWAMTKCRVTVHDRGHQTPAFGRLESRLRKLRCSFTGIGARCQIEKAGAERPTCAKKESLCSPHLSPTGLEPSLFVLLQGSTGWAVGRVDVFGAR